MRCFKGVNTLTAPNGLLAENDIKAELSHAYLYAVAARAGYTYQRGAQPDRNSVDAIVESGEEYKPKLEFQLKSTSSPNVSEDGLRFRLSAKNYDDLREVPRICPMILVVLELPQNRDEWLDCDGEGLTMRRRAWWLSLADEPPTDAQTKTVMLPQSQLLTPDSIKDLMARARGWDLSSRRL